MPDDEQPTWRQRAEIARLRVQIRCMSVLLAVLRKAQRS